MKPDPDHGDDEALRSELTDTLAAAGHLRTEPWRRAMREVPRRTFLRDGLFRRNGTGWEPLTATHPDWLALCHRDEPVVTRVAGIRPDELGSVIYREPTHTSPAPSLAARILEEARIEDGMSVLHIGTGTGYLAALLTHRLGDHLVTTVELDRDVARRAREALSLAGYNPHLVNGNAVTGWEEATGPWDRIISTCAVITVPRLWFTLTRPGGQIITPVSGGMNAGALARLTVGEGGLLADPDVALGRLITPGGAELGLAHPQEPHPSGPLPDITTSERPAVITPDDLAEPTTRFVAQAAAPWLRDLRLPDGHLYWDPEAKVWAALRQDGDKWTVRQSGYPVWNRIEEQVNRWRADGSPGLHEFTVAATADGHLLTFWDDAR
ncbi:methyltransferase domain-containing protein [Streptomyces sp. NBC_01803]|uniref:methyltransferase domain-containing protein n=1 Tax=Streptomyces sp. NBC_01803 TaxID=2975946 RepID=UPI002DD9384F|nr:methyltransferase domain-containing protein [Streptomyces sp. NBC_01803]WSA46545.1 methyltransferase domain-containing protein [Streptomyces sp. NBC_01803]